MRTVCLFVLLCVSALSYGAKKYKLVEISTNLGNIKIRLYENTPRHSENFLKLVKAHHYDSLLFHRVIGDFMIQGGSSDSRHAPKETAVGMSNPGYTIEAEIRPEYRHFKGALAAARHLRRPQRLDPQEQHRAVCLRKGSDRGHAQRPERQLRQLGALLHRLQYV